MRLQAGMQQTRSIELVSPDPESLLVRFLGELLWLGQEEGLGFDDFSISVEEPYHLKAELGGAAIANLDKEIKAVTYHNLAVLSTPQGLRVSIVFDV
jgi:SHS2 domain-containing protein